eukprot:scaffold34109_cov73-Phaeocystis_antarctica.AAC.7
MTHRPTNMLYTHSNPGGAGGRREGEELRRRVRGTGCLLGGRWRLKVHLECLAALAARRVDCADLELIAQRLAT